MGLFWKGKSIYPFRSYRKVKKKMHFFQQFRNFSNAFWSSDYSKAALFENFELGFLGT